MLKSHVPMMGRAVLAGLLGLCATGAMATGNSELLVSQHPDPDTRSIEVRVSDLNLADAKGQRALALRVTRAAREVCDIHGGSDLDKMPSAQLCFTTAANDAFAQLAARGVPATAIAAAGGMI